MMRKRTGSGHLWLVVVDGCAGASRSGRFGGVCPCARDLMKLVVTWIQKRLEQSIFD